MLPTLEVAWHKASLVVFERRRVDLLRLSCQELTIFVGSQ